MGRVRTIIALGLLAVELGPGFIGASATTEEVDAGTVLVELVVEVEAGGGPVVAHLRLPGEAQLTTALVQRRQGVWGGFLELRRAEWRVVFESLSTGRLSRPVTLSELGVDVADPSGGVVGPPGAVDPMPWGLLSAACAAAALLLGGGVILSDRSFKPRHLRAPRSRRAAGT